MKVTINTSQCAGHARCNAIAPDVYELDDGGYVLPFDGEVPAELEVSARKGAEVCPERAITVS
ncbi:ferredoxin [Williamsia sp. R60]